MIFERHENLEYKYSSRYFCYRWYYVGTVGKNKNALHRITPDK